MHHMPDLEDVPTPAENIKNMDDIWPVGKKSAYFSLFVAFLLGIMDFIDRQVIAALFPYLKAEYTLSDTQLGVLVAIVNVAIAILVIPSAYLIDRWSRKKMLCIMGVIWSIGTGACAFVGSYSHLVAARFFVGFGEAGYAPASQSLVAASFPKRLRATAIAILQTAPALGVPLGLIIGAFIAEHWSWRHAFGVVAIPGIFISFLALYVKDFKNQPKHDDKAEAAAAAAAIEAGVERKAVKQESYFQELMALVRTPSMLCVYLACISGMLFSTSVMNWLPSYFNRAAGMSVTTASTIAAATMVVGTFATLLSGPVLDWLRRKGPLTVLYVQSGLAFLQFVLCFFIYSVVTPGSTIQFVLLFIQCCTGCTLVPLAFTLVADLSHPRKRGTAVSMVITLQNVFGMAVGPLITGIISDIFDLSTAMTIVSGAYIIVGISFFIMTFTYQRDLARLGDVSVEF